jgi:hypothetical protein
MDKIGLSMFDSELQHNKQIIHRFKQLYIKKYNRPISDHEAFELTRFMLGVVFLIHKTNKTVYNSHAR